MDVLAELRKVGHALQPKCEPIPLTMGNMGVVGYADHRRGLYLNPLTARHIRAMIRDNERADRAARDISNGRLTAADILPVAGLGTDHTDAIRAIQSMRGAITSWDSIVTARGANRFWDFIGTKASQTTVANRWSSFARSGGMPGAMSYSNIPGPAALDSATTGAWPLPMSLGATDSLYLTNFACNHATGTNIVLAVDLLMAAGNILTSI